MDGVSGGRANAVEMGNELGANGCISEVAFHHAELALSILLSSIELDLLVLYCLEFTLMCPIPVYISDNTRVLEIYDGVVDEESRRGGRMEDVEVIILDPRTIEVGGRVCACVKGNGVFGVSLLMNSYDVSIDSNLSEGDVLRYFILPVLIKEDKGVLLHITVVILTPSNSWMVRVVKLFSELGNI